MAGALEGYRLSPLQARLWRRQQLAQGVFGARCAIRLRGELSPPRLQQALRDIVARHEILRTRFPALAGMEMPLQVVDEESAFDFRQVDSEGPAVLDRLWCHDGEIDLEGQVLHCQLLRESSDRHVLFLTLPSLNADVCSLDLLMQEIARAYVTAGEEPAEEPVQYLDYSEWHNDLGETEDGPQGQAFWASRNLSLLRPLKLPQASLAADETAVPGDSTAPKVDSTPIPLETGIAERLTQAADRAGCSLEGLLLVAWQALLSRLTGETEVVVDVYSPGRRIEALRHGLGLFEGYLPVPSRLHETSQIAERATTASEQLTAIQAWQESFPWQSDGEPSVAPAYLEEPPIAFGFELWPAAERAGEIELSMLRRSCLTEPFRLKLAVVVRDGVPELTLRYDPAHFAAVEAKLLAARLATVVGQVSADLRVRTGDLDTLGSRERQLMLDEWNRTSRQWRDIQPVHELFEIRAEKDADLPAILWPAAEPVTFGELNARANRLAHHLRDLGVGPESRVGLYLERSPDMLIALLGVWKAGGAFVPMDPSQPPKRLHRMLSDAGLCAIVTLGAMAEDLPPCDQPVVRLDDDDAAILRYSAANPTATVDPRQQAYVIFTSGSTGRPKGVVVEHRSLSNLVPALDESVYAGTDGPLRVAVNAPLTFDASIKQLVRWARGDALCLVPEEFRPDGQAMVDYLGRQQVDVLDCTPSQLRLVVDAGLHQQKARPSRILVGGESISSALWDELTSSPITYFNVYGPTEATVDTTVCRVAPRPGPPSIGSPLANVRVYVVDPRLRPVPMGLAGELAIGGAGLARGYAGDPPRTAERFVAAPSFGTDMVAPGSRLYLTGDRVRWLEAGELEYLGRLDHQVKVRGFRVELGEIESVLEESPQVARAVVVVRPQGGQEDRLVGYVLPEVRLEDELAGRSRYPLPNGMSVVLLDRVETDYIYREIFEDRCYLRHGLTLPEDAVVFDVGANIGLFTLFAGQQSPGAQIYAFEPIAEVFETLEINTRLYGPEVQLFPYGLSDVERTERFTFYPSYSARSGLATYADPDDEVAVIKRYLENEVRLGAEGAEELLAEADDLLSGKFVHQDVECRLRRVSDVMRDEGLERIDLLKIDVQRSELDVLRGIDAEDWPKIGQVAMEVHDLGGSRVAEVLSLLRAQGYEAVAEQDDVLRGTDRFNVFARRDWDRLRSPSSTRPVATAQAPAPAPELSPETLRRYLQERLPQPMVPQELVVLSDLPYTRSGKVDREALPAPEEVWGERERSVKPARTPIEELMVSIWSEVLGCERLGVDENFFELGGHSLLATQLAARVREAFTVELPLRKLFEAPTIELLAAQVDALRRAGRGLEMPPIVPALRTDFEATGPPLSFAQQRLWFLDQLVPGLAVYNVPVVLRVSGELRTELFTRTLSEVMRRHEVLRTHFPEVDGVAVQVIEPPSPVPILELDLSALPEDEREAAMLSRVRTEALRPFDLGRGPLLRAFLLRMSAQDQVVMVAMHHIISDAWSMEVLVREVSALYSTFLRGEPSPLAELPVQYADYAVWQHRWFAEEALTREVDYWRQKLQDSPALELPLDRPRPPVQSFNGDRVIFRLEAQTGALRKLGQSAGASLYMTLLATYHALLHRVCGQDLIKVGTAISGRQQLEVQDLIGIFVNVLVIQADLSQDPSFGELLPQVRDNELEAFDHSDVPFEKLVQELEPERNLGRQPLVQTVFAQETERRALELPGLTLTPVKLEMPLSKWDLMLGLFETGDDLLGIFNFDVTLFDRTSIERLAKYYQTLVGAILNDPGRRLSELTLLSAGERQQLVVEWNDSRSAYPRELSIPAAFALQVARTPDAPAVELGDQALSYRQLADRSRRLAGRLRVRPGEPVGVCVEPGADMVVALLAVLQAGGCYLPLDPDYPLDRLSTMVENSGASLVLTQEKLVDRLPQVVGQRVVERRVLEAEIAGATDAPASPPPDPARLAYVTYTSGSTGQPKGIGIPHRAVVRLVLETDYAQLGPGDRVAQVANISFDAATFEIWGALLTGATLVCVRRDVTLAPARFAAELKRSEISALFLTTALFNQIVREAPQAFSSLRYLLFGGEAVNPDRVREALEPGRRFEGRLLHVYGPTEGTTFSTWQRVVEVAAEAPTVSIGLPIRNGQAHVVDRKLFPVPVGVVGELVIGGDGLARGYFGRPALTAERFVPTGTPEAGARVYRTGDLVRRQASGAIDFVGRFDHQVKLRGFRVELGEIEAILDRHPAVSESAVVVADAGTDRRLVAYVATAPGGTIVEGELRTFLQQQLPDYMVPSAWVELPSLPLSAHGKVDRSALPDPDESRPELVQAFVPPSTPVEETLAEIWSEVLPVDQVGVHDDFFELGGHSLLATQMISRVRQTFGVELPLPALFEAPTVAELARRVAAAQQAAGGLAAPPIEPVARDRSLPQAALPVSFAQQRLWFVDQLQPGMATYNMPIALRVRGELDTQVLALTLSEIIRRHEALRTVFAEEDGEPVQIIRAAAPVSLPVTDLSALPEATRKAETTRLVHSEVMRPFDLARGPLIRAALLRLGDGDQAVMVTMHHIVSDGWSLDVMLREVAQIYPALLAGKPSPLPALPVQYGDFAAWQRQWLQGEVLEKELAYWRQALRDTPPLELPTDRPRPPIQTYRGDKVIFRLGDPEPLRALARKAGATDFMALLATFQTLLHRTSGQHVIAVGTPIAGRNRFEIENLIGFFVNSLVMRTDFSGSPSFAEVLARVNKTAMGAFGHQDLPFEKLVEELQPERHLSHQPLFQTMFSSIPERQETLEVPGLTLEPLEKGAAIAKWDLMLFLFERPDEVMGAVNYNLDLFDRSTATRLARCLEALIRAATAEPQRPVSELALLAAPERQQLLIEWNDTASGWPRQRSIPEIFVRQASDGPDSVAVEFGDQRLSYRELERRSSNLARSLRVEPEEPVGLCVEPGVDMVIALVAVLRAGGTYLPLDPEYPPERLRLMTEDSSLGVILTQEELLPRLPETAAGRDIERIVVGTVGSERPEGALADPPDPAQLAYVTYTSGSTGRPKGIGVPHHAVLRLVLDTDYAQLGRGDRIGQVSNISFDAATFEVWGTLLTGATLVGVPREVALAPEVFATALTERRISAMFLTAALFNQVARQVPQAFESVRHLLVGGEALDPVWIRKVLEEGPPARLLNGYGPTENTTFSTWYRVEKLAPDARSIPIGRPIASSRAHVVDRQLRPVPRGISGELVLGGDGLARGYFGRPALTAERFVPSLDDGSRTEAGARLYRTGDLVRRLAGGEIDFLGRLDHQVKMRGFRIELGEIEVVLGQHPDVAEAVVRLSGEGSDQRLVAYVVAAEGAFAESELRAYLKQRIPEYMIPAIFIAMESLPLSAHGKLDRKALPEPDGLRPEQAAEYTAPRSPAEQMLSDIWSQVLQVDRVGIHDSFFDLGGHSLLATRLASRIRQAFEVELPLRAIFEAPTVATLTHKVEAARHAGRGPEAPPLVPVDRDQPLPMSFAQQRLWVIDQLQPGSPAYNMPIALRVFGRLQVPILQRALSEVVRRHEVLRTRFDSYLGEPAQMIEPAASFPLPVVDLADLSPLERSPEARRWVAADFRHSYDLALGPLFRATVLRLADDEYLVMVNMHHIVSDGWSIDVFVKEISTLYQVFLDGRPSPLPELPVQYADFSVWQRERLQGEVLAAGVSYWKSVLGTAHKSQDLLTDRPRPPVQTFRSSRQRLELKGFRKTLSAMGRQLGATPFITLLAAYHVLLGRYSGQTAVNVGTPVSGRNHLEVEGLIGFFVNTLVIRAACGDDPTFSEAVRRVREAVLGAFDHQEIPFEKLVEELQPERDLSRQPLYQSFFTLVAERQDSLELPGLRLEPVAFDDAALDAKFDLSLGFIEAGDDLHGYLAYAVDLFDPSTMARMARHFGPLVRALVDSPERRISELSLLTAGERHQIVVDWNDTTSAYPRLSIPEAFALQVARAPERVAMELGDQRWTYNELDRRSACLAESLRISAEEPVGLCVEPGAEMVVALVAVLRAGAAYLPLDPEYPPERLSLMVEDSGASVILTQDRLRFRLPQKVANRSVEHIVLDTIATAAGGTELVSPDPAQLAYVTYTSGSTGRPKGIGIPHHAVLRLVLETDYAQLGPGDRVAQASNISFDAATFEIWGALLTGATLVGVPRETALAPEDFASMLAERKISTLFLTTALFNLMARDAAQGFASLRHLLFGGEAVDPGRVRQVLAEGAPERLLHVYGPTEGTTFSTWQRVANVEEHAPTVPIGQPIASSQAYVVDRRLDPVPLRVTGELLLGGDGLARGYFGQPALSAERFIPDPLGPEPGVRLYRTGDLVRRLAGGEIEFVGRFDGQVKLRGFRIELGEIEAALLGHPAVSEGAVTLYGESADKRLVAYLVPSQDTLPSDDELRSYLRERLPNYMVPQTFIDLDALPLTAHGKVDRRALPVPGAPDGGGAYVPPRTPDEELLATLWCELLGIDKVGIYDNFFDLGGHSLLATQVASRVRQALGVELPLREVFEHPTIAELARAVEKARATDPAFQAPPLEPAGRDRDLPLSFAQQRLWFIDRLLPDSTTYNMPIALRAEGKPDITLLERCLTEIVIRHEVLRTSFRMVYSEPVQVIAPPGPVTLPVVDLTALPAADRESVALRQARFFARRPFDLAHGPVLRMAMLRLAEDDHVVLMIKHHITSDGWSMGVLVRELTTLYEAFSARKPSPLPELPIQYADYAVWQRQWLRGEVLEHHLDYWRQHLADAPPLLELPTDRPRRAIEKLRGGRRSFELPAEVTTAMSELRRRQRATTYMMLLAGFQALLARYSGQRDIALGTPMAGRTHVETEGLIGLFVNTLVLRSELAGGSSFLDLVRHARELTLEAQSHQILPFEKLVEELQPRRSLSHTPLFQVMFVVQNIPESGEGLRLPGLTLRPYEPLDTPGGGFDLTLLMHEGDDRLRGSLDYNSDLFDAATIKRFIAHYQVLLRGMLAEPERPFDAVPLLSASERFQLLTGWNDTAAAIPAATLHGLFAAQAARRPQAPALLSRETALTYDQVERRSNRLAHRLRRLGTGPEDLVAICLERSPEMTVAVLAVLKAGGAYLPLDPSYPPQRLSFMLEDSGASLLLTRGNVGFRPEGEFRTFDLDAEAATVAGEDADPPPAELSGERLAYVIYTSGSTGHPKGVMVPHAGLTNLALAQARIFGIEEHSRVLQFAALSFDASISEIAMALVSGAALYFGSRGEMMPGAPLAELLRERSITAVTLPPSSLAVLPRQDLPELATLVTAGEACPAELAAAWAAGRRMINAYGPTETTVCATAGAPLRALAAQELRPDIGRPLTNLRTYVADARCRPVPIGAAGELLVGGVAVARGYLGRPGLSAERFIPDPFGGTAGNRLYRTGDRVRQLADGRFDFLGRIDYQLKLRGFRIEPGEIADALGRHPRVRETAVVARAAAGDEQRIVAYYVAETQALTHTGSQGDEAAATPGEGVQQLDAEELRKYLKERMPEHMIPAHFVPLEVLPLLPNGKIDRAALPATTRDLVAAGERVEPRDKVEARLVEIWQEVLGVDAVGIRDNFFDLGGHSLLAVRLVSAIERMLGKKLAVATIFQAPTIEELAELIRSDANTGRSLVPIQPRGDGPRLYLTHTASGNIFSYQRLAAEMHRLHGTRVYAFQAQGLGGDVPPYDRVEDMASHYIEELLEADPEGPYSLCGWSVGGVIVFEMAHQLEKMGRDVALLTLLDSRVPTDYDRSVINNEVWILHLFARDFGISLIELGVSEGDILGLTEDERFSFVYEKAQAAGSLPPEIDEEQIRRLYRVFKATAQAMAKYRPPTYHGPMTFVRSKEPLPEELRPDADLTEKIASKRRFLSRSLKTKIWQKLMTPALGWEEHVAGKVDLVEIGGHHFQMLNSPHLERLVEILAERIARTGDEP